MKLKEQLQALLQALQADDPTDFIQLVQDHVGRKEGHDLEELLQAAQRKDIVAVCLGLKHQTEVGVELFSSEEAAEEEGEEPVVTEQQELGAEVLYHAAVLVRLLLSQTKAAPPEGLQQAAELLHDHGLLAAANFQGLQDEVAKMCLEWWQAEAVGREMLTPQAVPYLFVKAIATGTAADVKRCHSMRSALLLFDFDDPSIADLKRLLLQAAFAPSFLRCAEGRRLVAFLFNLQPALVEELTAIIKNQIPSGRKSVLEGYGEILYRAWSSCTGACLLYVREKCIQELMECAILASTPAMAASLRRVLGGLHSQKHQPGVDKMLLELYEPILFRRLSAANPDVRRNALQLLVDAFPLRDPEDSNQDTDKRLNDQFAHLTNLLKDAVPEVRVAAVQGVCRILNEYWELIPGTVTAGYIKLMAGELAFDSSSPAVRAAVAEGLATLVDNSLAQPLLKVVLPQVKDLLFDSSTKVRTALADLLLSLRGVEALPFHSVVPVETLLEVMALDVAAVSERIQRLLLPTFFPNPEAGPAVVAALLRKNPAAGKAFCQYLAGTYQPEGGEPVVTAAGPAVHEGQIVGLIKDLRAHLLGAPIASAAAASGSAAEASGAGGRGGGKKGRSKRKKAQAQQRGDGEAGGEEEETDVEVSETSESWEAILQGMSALACGLAALIAAGRCEEQASSNLFLSGMLVQLLERCPSAASRRAVMAIAAAFPQLAASAEVRGRCLKLLLTGEYAAGHAEELRGALECVCRGDDSRARLLRVLVTSLNGEPEEVLGALLPGGNASAGAAADAGDGEDPREADANASEDQPVQGRGKRQQGGSKKAPAPAAAAKAVGGKKKKGRKAADEDEAEEVGEVDESLACEDCGSKACGGEMLLCDNCDAAYHMGCLDPPLTDIPKGDWFCPECDAMMSRGISQELAIRCLGLLLEFEGLRAQLVGSGALACLLPYVEVVLQDRVDALKQALASGSGTADGEEQAPACASMTVYLKGVLHLFLAGQLGAAKAEAVSVAGITSTSLTRQAAECTQQALDWGAALLQPLARLEPAVLLAAVASRTEPEAKRSKAGKKNKKAAAGPADAGASAAVREAFATVQACMLMLAEAARLQVLSWAAPAHSLAQGACALAQQLLVPLGSMAAAAAEQGGGDAPDADAVMAAALSNLARLACNLAVAAKLGAPSTTRDLDPILRQAEQQAGPVEGSDMALAEVQHSAGAGAAALESTALGGLVADLLALGCQAEDSPSTALVVAALRPSLPGLLAALCGGSTPAARAGSARASCRGGWLQPVVQLLGRGIDLEEAAVPGPQQLTAEEAGREEHDENAASAANQPADDDSSGGRGKDDKAAAAGAGAAVDLSGFASEHAGHPLVKQLLHAAKLAKVQEQLAGCSASAGVQAFAEGAARSALGALELCRLLGFKGVTARGKSRAGTDTYAAAIQQLRLLKEAVDGLPAEDLEGARALLHHKLHALFPPPPRVTFGAV